MRSRSGVVRPIFAVLFVLLAWLGMRARDPVHAQAPALTLADARFFGGPGDQSGKSIVVQNGTTIFVGSDTGQLLRYPVPSGAGKAGATLAGAGFAGVTLSGNKLYAVGWASPPTCGAKDGVGGAEPKTLMAVFDVTSGALAGCESANLLPYRGYENYKAALVGGGPYIYAAGVGETCGFGNNTFVLSRFDLSGHRIDTVGEPGVDFKGYSCTGASDAWGLVWMNGNLFVAGYSKLSGEDNVYRPVLMKYSPELARQWKRRSADVEGGFQSAAVVGGSIYGAGWAMVAGRSAFLVEKYSESGSRLWTRTSLGTGNSQLFGIANVGERVFAVGSTTKTTGDTDAVILEIDPATGATLSTTTWGGAKDDVAYGVASDGIDLFVVGASKSFASAEGNAVGQSDGVLLRFAPNTATTSVMLATNPSGLAIIADGTTFTAPKTLNWVAGSSHSVSVPSPQAAATGQRQAFTAWSDGGAIAHTITTPASAATFTATFKTQYQLTLTANPVTGGTITAAPAALDGYYDAGASVTVAAAAKPSYRFTSLSGELAGATNPQTIAVSAPRSITANFVPTLPPILLRTFVATSTKAPHPEVRVIVPDDYLLISGGCRDNWSGGGNLLVASYPESSNAWVCIGKDHAVSDPSTIDGFAVAIYDPDHAWSATTASNTSSVANWPQATVTLPSGYTLTGGGAIARYKGWGNMLTASMPNGTTGWTAKAKDHGVADPSTVTVYVIGIRPRNGATMPSVTVFQNRSAAGAHPATSVGVGSSYTLLGCGAFADWHGAGQLVTATYPSSRSDCNAQSKDHQYGEVASVVAYAIAIPVNPSQASKVTTITAEGQAVASQTAVLRVERDIFRNGGWWFRWVRPNPRGDGYNYGDALLQFKLGDLIPPGSKIISAVLNWKFSDIAAKTGATLGQGLGGDQAKLPGDHGSARCTRCSPARIDHWSPAAAVFASGIQVGGQKTYYFQNPAAGPSGVLDLLTIYPAGVLVGNTLTFSGTVQYNIGRPYFATEGQNADTEFDVMGQAHVDVSANLEVIFTVP